jgi:hypothetical protein
VDALGIFPLTRLMRHSRQPHDRELILDECSGEPSAPRRRLASVSPGTRRYEDDEFEDDDLYDEDDLDDDDLYEDDEFEDDDLFENNEDDETDRPLFRKFFPVVEPDWWVPDPQSIGSPKYYLN